MRDRINAMVKMREAFRRSRRRVRSRRSIAGSSRAQHELPFMIMTVNVREEFRDQLPAITTSTARPVQTVSPETTASFTSCYGVGRLRGARWS